MSAMTIGKLADAGGVGVETVRYYQRRQLLAEPDRIGGVRRYHLEDVARLRFIKAAQKAGFTLDEIGELLRLDAGTDHHRARELAYARIEALDAKIAELTAARTSLENLAEKCSVARNEPCPIIGAFEAAS